MINKFNVEGIDTRSNLYQRSKFFSVVERLDHMNYLDRQSFSDVVTLLDELVSSCYYYRASDSKLRLLASFAVILTTAKYLGRQPSC